jgi:hypothetical protein
LRRVSFDLTGFSLLHSCQFVADSSRWHLSALLIALASPPSANAGLAIGWTSSAKLISGIRTTFAERLAVPRLRHPRLQYRQTVRSLPPRTDRRRPAPTTPRRTQRQSDGHRISAAGDLSIVEATELARVDTVDQQVDKIGRAMLGMTIGCARCHDHKFDPISQRDYYALAGIFDVTDSVRRAPWGGWSFPATAELLESDDNRAAREARIKTHQNRIETLKAELQRAQERKTAIGAILKQSAAPGEVPREALEREGKDLDARLRQIDAEITHAEFFMPAAAQAFAVRDLPEPHDMRLTIRGNPHVLGDSVPRGFPAVIPPKAAEPIPAGQSGRRQLADWVTNPENPLTARVAVNRIWQKLFGEGIVRSVDYFGLRGELPSHPELLDSMSATFMAEGWSQKRIIRKLVLSRAYRMSSRHDPAMSALDGGNKWLWRMPRRRLDAEALRDAMLSVSGRLVPISGGPALPLEFVENTGGLKKGEVNPPSFTLARFRPEQEYVRTVYLPVIRSGPQAGPAEVRNVFDFTQPAEFAGRRAATTVPTQALFLMNSRMLKSRSRELAERIRTNAEDDSGRLATLWLTVLNRLITADEQTESYAFLTSIRQQLAPDSQDAPDILDRRAWSELCHALLASNEFLLLQ